MPLPFVGKTTTIRMDDNETQPDFEIPAMDTTIGTSPAGSAWRRNPIPACYGPGGGAEMSDCDGPQFPPAIPGLYGFGPGRCTSGLPYNFRGQHKYCTPHSLSLIV